MIFLQDDEYLAALQADKEKELLEQAAREAAMEEERRKEEDAKRKLELEQVMADLIYHSDSPGILLYERFCV